MKPIPNVPTVVIFSIDDTSTRGLYKFYRFVDQQTAMGKFKDFPVVPLIGMYKGKPEHSFMVGLQDAIDTGIADKFALGQEEILAVYPDRLTFSGNLKREDWSFLGEMIEVPYEATAGSDWIYNTVTKKYFTVV